MLRRKSLSVLALVMVWVMALSVVATAAPDVSETISNKLEATLSEEAEEVDAEIVINDDLSRNSVVGLWDEFSVTTFVYEGEGTGVRAKIELIGDPEWTAGFELEYFEPSGGQNEFKRLNFDGSGVAWFGPAGGFPLTDGATSYFRVTWSQAGTYEFKVSLVDAENTENELVATDQPVVVRVGANTEDALALTWKVGDEGTFDQQEKDLKFGDEVTVKAELKNDISHIDSVLYVVKVTKGENEDRAEPGDITFKAGDGQNLGYDNDEQFFYWGPRTGFQFGCHAGQNPPQCAPNGATTSFKANVNTKADYKITAYAVQLKATSQGVLDKGN